MAVNKLFVIIGVVVLVQSIYSAPVENQSSDDCRCTRQYLPVCASDNITYSNKCLFQCEKRRNHNLVIKYTGECGENEIAPVPYNTEDCACPLIFDPICGTDDNTYSNECSLNCVGKSIKNLEMRHKGECSEEEKVVPVPYNTEDCVCARNFAPVCGSDGHTYSNECTFQCAKRNNNSLIVNHRGRC